MISVHDIWHGLSAIRPHSAPSNQRMYSDTPAGGTAFGGLMGAPPVGPFQSKY
jgi:hypothetical protein